MASSFEKLILVILNVMGAAHEIVVLIAYALSCIIVRSDALRLETAKQPPS